MKKLYIFLFALLPVMGFAQGQGVLYQLHHTVPQANELNPALMPEFRVNVSLPSPYFKFTSPVSLNDAVTFTETGSKLNEEALFERTRNHSDFKFNTDVSLMHIGIRGANSYFSITSNFNAIGTGGISPELISWGLFGPAHENNVGRPLDFSGTGANLLAYADIGVGYARRINHKLTVGGRVKYVMGLANVDMDLDMQLYMNMDSVSLVNNGMNIKMAGASFLVEADTESFGFEPVYGEYGPSEYMDYAFKNTGFAVDFGASYQLTHRLLVSASVKDLGAINWKEYTTTYYTDPSTFTFKGVETDGISGIEESFSNYENLVDSVLESYTLKSEEGAASRTFLPTSIYMGAEYQLGKNHKVSGLIHSRIWKGSLNPALSLAYNLQLGKYLNTVVNWSAANGKFTNAGLGLSARALGLQVYVVSDNALTPLFALKDVTSFDFRFGLNFAFGYMRRTF